MRHRLCLCYAVMKMAIISIVLSALVLWALA